MSRQSHLGASFTAGRNVVKILATGGGIEQLFRLQQAAPGGAAPGGAPGGET